MLTDVPIALQLLKTGELTPGINETEYEARRIAFIAALPSTSIALLPAAAGVFMAGHIPFPYRQVADCTIQGQAVHVKGTW